MPWLFCFIFNVFIITANWLEAICVAARTQSPFPWKLWISMLDMWHVTIHGSPISPFRGLGVSLSGSSVACYCVRARNELPLPPWWTEAPTRLFFFWVVAVPFFLLFYLLKSRKCVCTVLFSPWSLLRLSLPLSLFPAVGTLTLPSHLSRPLLPW